MGLVLMVDPWAKHVEWSGGAAVELRGGLAPPQPSASSVPTLRLTIAPQAMLTYEDRVRGRRVSLEYTPQLYLSAFQGKAELSQVPARPLFFHRATLRYAGLFDPRWSWQGSAGASIGEQDYSLQSGGLVQGDGSTPGSGPTQSQLLDDPIITTGGVSAGVGVTGRLTPVHSIAFGPSVTVQRQLDRPPAGANPTTISFDQTSADLAISHAWLASRVDTLGTEVSGGYVDFGPVNGSQAFGSGDLTWRRRLRPRLESQVLGGVFATRQVRARQTTAAAVNSRSVPLLPVVDLGLTGRLLERSRLRISTAVDVGSRAYFDPVQGSVLPLAGGGAALSFHMPPDLTAGIAATFYTPPLPPTAVDEAEAANPASARTTLTLRTPVTYRIDRHYAVEVGTIVNARGPHLGVDAPVGRFPQTEVWLYVSFLLRYTTSSSTR